MCISLPNVSCRHPYICQCSVIDGLLPLWFPSPQHCCPSGCCGGGTFLPLATKKPNQPTSSISHLSKKLPTVTALSTQMETPGKDLSRQHCRLPICWYFCWVWLIESEVTPNSNIMMRWAGLYILSQTLFKFCKVYHHHLLQTVISARGLGPKRS